MEGTDIYNSWSRGAHFLICIDLVFASWDPIDKISVWATSFLEQIPLERRKGEELETPNTFTVANKLEEKGVDTWREIGNQKFYFYYFENGSFTILSKDW